MSDLDTTPSEIPCAAGPATPAVQVLPPRLVPLGGPRAMTVRRALPSRQRTLIGAWCFVDHYGPDDVAETGGMVVAPHPHTGLQTVSWLFTGEVEHRDSAGNEALVRPGELNLMTAGRGISHSENSTPAATVLHGAQLWVALPDAARDTDPGFDHYAPDAVQGPGYEARVFLGSLLGSVSPVATHTPLLGAELVLAAEAEVVVPVPPDHELGVLLDTGSLTVDGTPLQPADLGYLAPGRDALRLRAGSDGARLLLLGGPPFGEEIVMFWNFIGRDHDEIVGYRDAWQAQVAGGRDAPGRFGVVAGDQERIPAPELPNVRLRRRS
ncbi:pirin family protein [Nocardioides fonticola]|uniref:Pirin family protein n=1 Tax=Nocardioides fonticola TaxID=450363 RepID=A0ABP7XNK6_9ACTN